MPFDGVIDVEIVPSDPSECGAGILPKGEGGLRFIAERLDKPLPATFLWDYRTFYDRQGDSGRGCAIGLLFHEGVTSRVLSNVGIMHHLGMTSRELSETFGGYCAAKGQSVTPADVARSIRHVLRRRELHRGLSARFT